MKTIQLTQGKATTVDAADYDRLTAMGSWRFNQGYAVGDERMPNGKRLVQMHRVITDAPDDMHVDHIDGDGLNNTRSNLRLCSNAENSRNRHAQRNSRSGIKGVFWNARRDKWEAQIRVNGRRSHLGYYQNPTDAARAYDKAAIELHGEYARTNDLDPYGWDMSQFLKLAAATCKRC